MAPDALNDLSPPWRRLLLFLFGGACTVVVAAGVRSAAGVLNPMLGAAFLALLLQPLLQKLRGALGGAAVAVVALVVVLVGLVLVGFVGASLRQLALELPRYQNQFRNLVASGVRRLAARGIDVTAYTGSTAAGRAVATTLLSITGSVAGTVRDLVLTYLIFAFMLGRMSGLERRASMRAEDQSALAARFLALSSTIRTYMAVRSILGLTAAVLDFLILLATGVEYPLLWAVLTFVLSFVPTIGSALALIPPVLLALLNYGWLRAAIVFVAYEVVNILLGDVIGPRFIGRQVKISPLLSFLSVLFWAWLLGPPGAILSVPLTVLVRDLAFGPAEDTAQVRPHPGVPSPPPTP